MLAFFNDLESAPENELAAAAQFFSTYGFFPDFDARLDEPLDGGTAREWLRAGLAPQSPADPLAVARAVAAAAARREPAPSRRTLPGGEDQVGAAAPDVPVTRGEALRALWRQVRSRPPAAASAPAAS
jgi:hypothetical protein